MKKNYLLIVLLFPALLFISLSCKRPNPAGPVTDTPTGTPVQATRTATGSNTGTPTATLTFTNTFTVTVSRTASPTMTVTPTFTPNSFPFAVDDYEDGNTLTKIQCADCTNNTYQMYNPGAVIMSFGVTPSYGDPEIGNYYYSVTGTVKRDGNTSIIPYMEMFLQGASHIGVNITGAQYLDFSCKYSGQAEGAVRVDIDKYGTGSVSAAFNPVNDNAWHNYSLPISSFTGTLANILPSAFRIAYYVRTADSASPSSDVYFEFSIDNIRFE